MNNFTLVLIAIGLSMDSFSVSFANGIYYVRFKLSKIILVATVFAAVQGLFTFLGWKIGALTMIFLQDFDHWIAFGLLTYIGIKMVIEQPSHDIRSIALYKIFILAAATSIDALAVGFGMGTINQPILKLTIFIIAATFIFTLAGLLAGRMVRRQVKFNISALGGVILIIIGVKILLEHLNEHYWHWF